MLSHAHFDAFLDKRPAGVRNPAPAKRPEGAPADEVVRRLAEDFGLCHERATAIHGILTNSDGPRSQPGSEVAPASRQMLSKPQFRRIVEFVEANLDGDLKLAQVAQVARMSVPHLTTLFRRTVGQSVHAYIMERRVRQAHKLLLDRRMTVTQVALETGFAHQSHLARWMRRTLGVTPKQIRHGQGSAACRFPAR